MGVGAPHGCPDTPALRAARVYGFGRIVKLSPPGRQGAVPSSAPVNVASVLLRVCIFGSHPGQSCEFT